MSEQRPHRIEVTVERSVSPEDPQVVLRHVARRPRESEAERQAVLAEALATLPSAGGRDSGQDGAPDRALAIWMDHVRYRRTRCPAARERLVEEYSGYARHLAGRFVRSVELREDLEQVALEALIVALDRFDPARATPFLGFAAPTIAGSLKRYHRDHGWALRVPRRVHELAGPIRQAAELLAQDLGRQPTDDEIADLLGVPLAEVRATSTATAARSATSLDVGTERRVEPGTVDPAFARVDDLAAVQRAVATLDARAREVLALYYGDGLSQSTIAARLGVSQMQVSRLLSQALAQLRSRVPV